MNRKIYLTCFVAFGWAVFTLSEGQTNFCPTSVAQWTWPKVTEMGAKIFSHTNRLTMCCLKELASGVFLESWKVLAERWWGRLRKRTKHNKSPGYPRWLNYSWHILPCFSIFHFVDILFWFPCYQLQRHDLYTQSLIFSQYPHHIQYQCQAYIIVTFLSSEYHVFQCSMEGTRATLMGRSYTCSKTSINMMEYLDV